MSGTRGVGGGSKAGNDKGSGGTHKGGAGTIPQSSKKMLQSLKEIVNCPEAEIYAMLKECNMDPNEAVNRLLSQDPFHQVKSKREKKKENKDATGLRSHGTIGTSNRVVRGGNDRYSHAILSQFSSSESVGLPYKNYNGDTKTSSSFGPGVAGNNMNWMPLAASEMSVEDKSLTVNNSEGVSFSQHASSFQSPWLGVPGQVSMADIVKMGRPHVRGSSNATRSHQSAADYHVAASQFAPTPQELYSSQNYVAKVSDVNLNLGLDGSRNVPELDDWPQDEQPSTLSMPLESEPQVTYEAEPYEDPSRLLFDRTSHHLDDFQCADDAEPDSVIPSKMQDESSGSAPILNDELHDAYENQEVEDIGVSVSSVATNVHQLSLSKEEDNSFPERESPVKIPEHLQVRSADCSHLSFGSFGSGISVPFSGLFASKPSKCDVEETSAADDAQSLGNTDSRSSYEDEHLRTASGGNSDHRLGVSSGKYDMPSASQSDTLKQEAPEVVARGNEYSFPSSSPNYTFENSQHLNPSLSHSQISSQMQNLPILSGIMPYSSSMPSSLLPTNNVHPDRDAERSYSPFHITPSMPTKFGSSATEPINVPSGSMHEALKTGNFPSPELTQNIPVSNISEGLTFPQHLPVHPYSQPSFPFANMISYPFMPQSYTYMPPAFQQALAAASNGSYAFQQAIAAAGNSTYHQSPSAGVLPQYKNSVSASSLPQSAGVPSGYGAFGNSTGNFSMNPPSAAPPTASSVNYEDILSSQYKDAAQLLALQQIGSGKTYTMLGDIDDLEFKPSLHRGMTSRIFEYLFARIRAEEESRRDDQLKYSCKCSFLEIYNEQITDLLNPSSTNLLLREDMRKGIYVENLSEFEVYSVGDILNLLVQGSLNRKVAATNMNMESSRSHSVFTCVIESKWERDSTTNMRFARLNLVDLAGSERQKTSGAEGERLKEAANINKSLSTLGHVIMVLVDVANGKIRHVPYRDSKLTFLLQESLGGNSKTIIIANISPSTGCASETLNTLKFAQRAKLIQNNVSL